MGVDRGQSLFCKVVSTLYHADEGETEQEFGWWADRRFYAILRITSGYYMNDHGRAALHSAMHNFGVVSHFIHPDDVFSQARSNGYKGWEWLKRSFAAEFDAVKESYPWLRWYTVRDACGKLLFYKNAVIRAKKEGKTITVYHSDGSDEYIFFRVRMDPGQKVDRLGGCSLVSENRDSGDFVFKTTNRVSTIAFK